MTAATSPTVDKQFLFDRQGKTTVLYAGLLDLAHKSGVSKIETMVLQIGGPENGDTWIVRAEVVVERGLFTGLGEAAPNNLGAQVKNRPLAIAETRSIGRALKNALNIPAAIAVEIGEDDVGERSSDRQANRVSSERGAARPAAAQPTAAPRAQSPPSPGSTVAAAPASAATSATTAPAAPLGSVAQPALIDQMEGKTEPPTAQQLGRIDQLESMLGLDDRKIAEAERRAGITIAHPIDKRTAEQLLTLLWTDAQRAGHPVGPRP